MNPELTLSLGQCNHGGITTIVLSLYKEYPILHAKCQDHMMDFKCVYIIDIAAILLM